MNEFNIVRELCCTWNRVFRLLIMDVVIYNVGVNYGLLASIVIAYIIIIIEFGDCYATINSALVNVFIEKVNLLEMHSKMNDMSSTAKRIASLNESINSLLHTRKPFH